jgi:hypothetical protein
MQRQQQPQAEPQQTKLSSSAFYATYHGHSTNDLQFVLDGIKRNKPLGTGVIYLIGDSTLDNKFWFRDTASAINGYQSILNPPVSKQDIAYWMNAELGMQSCFASHFKCCRIASHLIVALHRIVMHRIASHRIASHRIASHRIASHHIASQCIA